MAHVPLDELECVRLLVDYLPSVMRLIFRHRRKGHRGLGPSLADPLPPPNQRREGRPNELARYPRVACADGHIQRQKTIACEECSGVGSGAAQRISVAKPQK